MARILHISDLHYCAKHLHWVDRAMAHAVATAIAEACDLAVIAGDSFDSALSIHEPAFVAWLRQVLALAEHMPVVVLQGTHSHDRPGSLDVLKALPSAHRIIVADEIGEYEEAGVRICTLPSLNKADPDVMVAGPVAWTAAVLAEFADDHDGTPGLPSILVTHGTVTGCTTESGYAMVSPDHEFSLAALAAADCDAVMLGHIHRHQAWPLVRTPSGAQTTIAYPGSLARLVHGHHDPVGFLIWEVDPGRPVQCEFHQSPARQLLEVEFPGLPNMADLRELAAQVQPDDAVRIRWSADEEHAHAVDKQAIRDLFSGAESCKLEPRVLPVQRVRAAGIGRAVTLADKLGHWSATTGSAAALPGMVARLHQVQSMDPAAIVAGIVGASAPVVELEQA